MKKTKRNVAIIVVLLFVCAAVYFNWSYNAQWGSADAEMAAAEDAAMAAANADGEAAAASASTDDYFAKARLTRQQSRDEALSLLKSASAAEDASQEVFIKAYKRADTLRQREYTKTWLVSIAVNTCRDIRRSAWLRHIDRRVALEDLPPAVCDFTPADDSVVREIMSLAPKYREALLLHYYQDLSAEDCAKALHLTVSGFYRRLKRAQAQLKTQLERWGFDKSE